MGTRHLIAAKIDGEYRLAQYGQFDGCPSGRGVQVLRFLHGWDRPAFEKKLCAARFLGTKELREIRQVWREQQLTEDQILRRYPEFNRKTSAEILGLLVSRPVGIGLVNSISFAADSLFCEWAYVIDLDENTFEVFRGFQKKNDHGVAGRFAHLEDYVAADSVYGVVALTKRYVLDDLPSEEQFVADLESDSENEAAA